MQQLERIEPPQGALIPLDVAKAHLRVTHSAEDTLIGLYTLAVEEALDGNLGQLKRALLTQDWRLTLSGFPCGAIRLPLPPFQEVLSFTYTPRDGAPITLSADAYRVRVDRNSAYISAAPGTYWPPGDMDAVTIEFRAGFGDAADDTPAPIRVAALLMLESLYQHRGTLTPAALVANPTVAALLALYRVPSW